MNPKKILIPLLLVLLSTIPLYAYTDKELKTIGYYYTIYIWIFIIFGWFAYQRYKASNNKKLFYKTSFFQAIVIPIAISLLVFTGVNIISPKKPVAPPVRTLSIKDVHAELEIRKKIEENFTNIDLTYEYIKLHYNNSLITENDFEIINFYQDKTFFDDINYRDIGFFGLAYCHYKIGKYEESTADLTKVANQNLKYYNYLKGCVALELKDTLSAVFYLKKELALYGTTNPMVLEVLIDTYQHQNAYKEIYRLSKEYNITTLVSPSYLRKVYIINNDM